MKYHQLASVSTPAAVSTWFQDELVNRGVDAAYTYYVLSLLKEPDGDDQYYYCPSTNANKTPYNPQATKPERRRLLAKRCAIECLKSAADSNEEFDALVEELLARLEPTEDAEADQNDNQRTPTKKTPLTGDNRRHSVARDRLDVDKEPRTLAELAKKYFDAFPALQVDERPLVSKTNGTDSISKEQDLLREEQQHQQQGVFKEQRKRKKNKRKSFSPALGLADDFKGLFKIDRTKNKGWGQSPGHLKAKPDSISTGATDKITTFRSTANIHETDMGSIVREDALLSRLTQKFDSKLAAIWADAPTVDHQSSLWKISLDLGGKPGGRTGADRACDEVIFSIPNLSIFSKILEDDDDSTNNVVKSQYNCSTGTGIIGSDFISEQIFESHPPPTICLKNSALNYDKDKTAFTEVIPTRKFSAANRILMGVERSVHDSQHTQYHSIGGNPLGPGVAGGTSAVVSAASSDPAIDSNSSPSTIDDAEDLLVSPRTHFTPIRVEPEQANLDDENRPPSSSLAELASYHLLPEPPRRHQHQQQLHHAATSAASHTAPAVTASKVSTSLKNIANSSNTNGSVCAAAAGGTTKQQRSLLKQQQKLILQQQELHKQHQLQATAQTNLTKVTSNQKQVQKLQQQYQQQQQQRRQQQQQQQQQQQ
ncbi:uncharacterized protein LOC111250615, partial [Varroa destructor]